MEQTHTLIIGAGVVGLTIARELIKKGHDDILIIEKEPILAKHASGRNSGVLHAGIYYKADSLKARFCLEGNYAMQDYCEANGLPLKKLGKVIVAKNEAELATLDEIYQRATANGATVSIIDEKELAEIEPYAKTCGKALYSPRTAMVDPKKIMQHFYEELLATGNVKIQFNTKFIAQKNKHIITNKGKIGYQYVINAAGSFADKIAHKFNIAKHLTLIPFKGTYRKLKPAYNYLANGNIYPVPNIQNPFLGVHFTRNIHGDVYVGPTAIPAFGRENYHILRDIGLDAPRIALQDVVMFIRNKKFRKNALTEPKKYIPRFFFNDAKQLVKELHPSWLESTPKVGIRPQLVNWKTKELVMDFLTEEGEHSLHILNAISPAFTCSLSFSKYIVENIK